MQSAYEPPITPKPKVQKPHLELRIFEGLFVFMLLAVLMIVLFQ